MVEKERKRQSATVDDDSAEKAKPWYKSRAFLIALSLVVFAVLLSKSSSLVWSTCLLWQLVHLQVSALQSWQKASAYMCHLPDILCGHVSETVLLYNMCWQPALLSHVLHVKMGALHLWSMAAELTVLPICPTDKPSGLACCACYSYSKRSGAVCSTLGYQTKALRF